MSIDVAIRRLKVDLTFSIGSEALNRVLIPEAETIGIAPGLSGDPRALVLIELKSAAIADRNS
jgi:hypothetical protein